MNTFTDKLTELNLGLDEEKLDAITKVFSEEVSHQYIPLHRFNEVNTKYKEATEAFEKAGADLKDSAEKYEELKKNFEEKEAGYTQKIEALEKDKVNGEKKFSIKEKLIGLCYNTEDVLSKLDIDGEDIDGQIEKIKESYPHYFKTDDADKKFFKNPDADKPDGAEGHDHNPNNLFSEFKRSEFSYFKK